MPFLMDYPIRPPSSRAVTSPAATSSPSPGTNSEPAADSVPQKAYCPAAQTAGPVRPTPQPDRAGSVCYPRWLDYELYRMLARADRLNKEQSRWGNWLKGGLAS